MLSESIYLLIQIYFLFNFVHLFVKLTNKKSPAAVCKTFNYSTIFPCSREWQLNQYNHTEKRKKSPAALQSSAIYSLQ